MLIHELFKTMHIITVCEGSHVFDMIIMKKYYMKRNWLIYTSLDDISRDDIGVSENKLHMRATKQIL